MVWVKWLILQAIAGVLCTKKKLCTHLIKKLFTNCANNGGLSKKEGFIYDMCWLMISFLFKHIRYYHKKMCTFNTSISTMSNFWQAPLSVVRSPSQPSWALVVTHYQQLRKETLLANLCHQADRYPLSFERSRVAFNLQIVRLVGYSYYKCLLFIPVMHILPLPIF